ncbi:putative nucleotidyltransferase substrate binding domain-containing protein [Aquifex sp.]
MITDIEDFLRTYYPFSSLSPSSLEILSRNIKIKYYPKGSVIFTEGSNPLEYLYIIRKGNVSLKSQGKEIDFLQEGDTFGYISLLTGNPPTSTAVAETGVILYLIPKEIFKKLVDKYPEFKNFFASSLAAKLSYTKEAIKKESSFEKFLTLQVKNLKIRVVPFVGEEETALHLAKKMVQENSGCVIVKGKQEGIVTERDILKKVVAKEKNPSEVKAKDIMSSPIIYVSTEDFLFDVILLMVKHNIRRVAVNDGEKILGVIEDRDIIAFETQNTLVLVKEIEKSRDTRDLSYLYSLMDDTILNLFSEGVRPEIISKLIAELNDKFISKAVKLAIKEIGLEPIAPFSILVLGSEGRKEQTLRTDQDNALIYDDSHLSLDVDLKEYFKTFGEKISDILLKIGFPPCPSNVMVRNVEWNKGKTEWIKTLENWFSNPEPQNTLKLGIFLDFRNAFGDKTLEEELRETVFRLAKENDLTIAYMLKDAVRFKPPLGLFGKLKTEKKGIDLKKGGIFPITHGVRVLSVRNAIRETNTLERISKLKDMNVIPNTLSEDLSEAFKYLQYIRLKSQTEKLKRGEEPDNYVNPDALTKIEKDLLKDAFKIVGEFQSFIENRYLLYLPS